MSSVVTSIPEASSNVEWVRNCDEYVGRHMSDLWVNAHVSVILHPWPTLVNRSTHERRCEETESDGARELLVESHLKSCNFYHGVGAEFICFGWLYVLKTDL
jgi:hypothetical protein